EGDELSEELTEVAKPRERDEVFAKGAARRERFAEARSQGLQAEEEGHERHRGPRDVGEAEDEAGPEGALGVEGEEKEGGTEGDADDVGREPDGALLGGEEIDGAEGEEGDEEEV